MVSPRASVGVGIPYTPVWVTPKTLTQAPIVLSHCFHCRVTYRVEIYCSKASFIRTLPSNKGLFTRVIVVFVVIPACIIGP